MVLVLHPVPVGAQFQHGPQASLAVAQRLVGALAVGDVPADADEADDRAIAIAERKFGGEQRPGRSASFEDRLLLLEERTALLDHDPVVLQKAARDFRRAEVGHRLAASFHLVEK